MIYPNGAARCCILVEWYRSKWYIVNAFWFVFEYSLWKATLGFGVLIDTKRLTNRNDRSAACQYIHDHHFLPLSTLLFPPLAAAATHLTCSPSPFIDSTRQLSTVIYFIVSPSIARHRSRTAPETSSIWWGTLQKLCFPENIGIIYIPQFSRFPSDEFGLEC